MVPKRAAKSGRRLVVHLVASLADQLVAAMVERSVDEWVERWAVCLVERKVDCSAPALAVRMEILWVVR
jgi:hypothetical protein